MNIAIILPNLCGGGAERLHVHLANDWFSRGYSVEFILMQKRGELIPLLQSGISVIDLGVENIRSAIFPLLVYLKKSRHDVLLAAMWPLTSAVFFSWVLSGRIGRLIISDHELLSCSYLGQSRVHPAYLKNLIKFTYPFVDGIVAVSAGVKNDLCKLGNLKSNKVKVIYNPAATGISSLPESQEISDALWGKDVGYHILAVGRLSVEKDYKTMIKAFYLLQKNISAKLVILGDGPAKDEIISFIKQHELQGYVDLPGFVTDPYPWFKSADLFVLSSLWEGFGNVIVEALECGVPVVSTDCPSGPAEILENGRYGQLVPVGNSVAMAVAIEKSLSQTHNKEFLISRAQDFSIRKISDQYLSYLLPKYHE